MNSSYICLRMYEWESRSIQMDTVNAMYPDVYNPVIPSFNSDVIDCGDRVDGDDAESDCDALDVEDECNIDCVDVDVDAEDECDVRCDSR